MKKKLFLRAGFIAAMAIFAVATAMFALKPELERIHDGIEKDYDHVEHVAAEEFIKLASEDVVIFDVREPDEYAVSHLPGAISVDPRISETEFQTRYADLLEEKTAVFYCSVGQRSSSLAERVAQVVLAKTKQAPVNLIGGLFQWSNERREMVAGDGAATHAIHPYNSHWGRLIKNRDAIATHQPHQRQR